MIFLNTNLSNKSVKYIANRYLSYVTMWLKRILNSYNYFYTKKKLPYLKI